MLVYLSLLAEASKHGPIHVPIYTGGSKDKQKNLAAAAFFEGNILSTRHSGFSSIFYAEW